MGRNNQTLIATKADGEARMRELAFIEEQEQLARERAKKNADFVQFSRKNMAEYGDLIERNSVAARLLVLMAEKMDRNNSLVCSSLVLEEMTNLSRTTVYRALKLLKDERWLEVVKIGTANVYSINAGVFWTTYGDRKHASFQATILVSSTEQEKSYKPQIELKRLPFLRKKDGERALLGSDKLPPPDQQHLDLI